MVRSPYFDDENLSWPAASYKDKYDKDQGPNLHILMMKTLAGRKLQIPKLEKDMKVQIQKVEQGPSIFLCEPDTDVSQKRAVFCE